MKLASLAAVLAIAAVAAPVAPAWAKCARGSNAPIVLTPRDTEIAGDGGVVVGYTDLRSTDDTADTPDASVQPGYRFEDGKVLLDARRVPIAPGLTLYVPASRPAGDVRLVDLEAGGRAKSVATYKQALPSRGAPLRMVPPQILAVTTRSGFKGPASAGVELSIDAPSNAIALVIYESNRGGARGRALGYGRPNGTHRLAVVPGGHCAFVPAGTHTPEPGSFVVFAWVDGNGHVSESSAPAVVTSGDPARDPD